MGTLSPKGQNDGGTAGTFGDEDAHPSRSGAMPLMLKAQEEMVRGKRKGEDGGSGVALRGCQAAPRNKKGRPHKRATGKGSVRDDDGGIKIKPRGIARLSFLWSPVVQL